ncbi:hypothetical protein A0J51_03142 [Gluconobacter japonicus]|nr:hypothetical protein A0J51_03142 [Gluconobacter japonicus]
MFFPTLARQHFLMLARGIALALLFRTLIMTMRAGHALYEQRRRLVLFADRTTAGMTDIVTANFQTMLHRDTLIEHEAFAFPEALFFRNGLQILQNTALKMINLIQPFGFHKRRGLLATDPPSAEHGNFRHLALCLKLFAPIAEPLGKLTE